MVLNWTAVCTAALTASSRTFPSTSGGTSVHAAKTAITANTGIGSRSFQVRLEESSFFPIPPDVLLIALCLGRPDLAFWFATVCAVASVLGGMAGYGIGFWGGRPLLKRLFRADRVRAVESYYDRYNAWATGIAGLTPIPYKVFTLSGGAFSIDFKIFVLASIVSRSLRFFAVAAK